MSIVVTATSGHLGRLVVQELLRRGVAPADIVAGARSLTDIKDLADAGVRTTVTSEQHLQALTGAGVPEPMAQMAVSVDAGIRAGAFSFTNGDLARLLGRPTTPLVEGLRPLA